MRASVSAEALEHALESLLDDCVGHLTLAHTVQKLTAVRWRCQVSPDLRETHGLGGDNMTAVVVLLAYHCRFVVVCKRTHG